MKSICLALLVSCLGLGCSSTVYFSDESRRTTRTISIDERMEISGTYSGRLPEVDITTRGSVWYSIWITAPYGMFLDIIDWSDNSHRRSQAFESKMEDAEVSVSNILRTELRAEIEERKIFDEVLSEGGDGRIILSINYGLSDGMGARGTWKPWLEVEARLVNTSGEVLWCDQVEVSSYDERVSEYYAPFREPEKLYNGFKRSARMLVEDLVNQLEGPYRTRS